VKEIAIILISHGEFAKYAMDSAQMIVGKQENYEVVSVTNNKDLENVIEEVKEAYKKLKNGREVLILADIFGGTPSNASSTILLEGADVVVYTGFNLAVLLELLLCRELPIEVIREKLEAVYKEGFINLNDKLKLQDTKEQYSL
jgi:PTS system mannose-specific IIA component